MSLILGFKYHGSYSGEIFPGTKQYINKNILKLRFILSISKINKSNIIIVLKYY